MEGMLTGRDVELDAMRAHVDRWRAGSGGVVLLAGEAGIGKTSLLRASFGDVERMMWVTGDELSSGFPLLPLVEAATQRGWRPGTAVELADWFADYCAASPTVLVFDDLHWADDASVRLWRRLAAMSERLPLLVVGALRQGAPVWRHVGDLGTLLELGPLAAGAVERVVGELVGGRPGRRLSSLVAAAGGNPRYVTELVATLTRDGDIEAARWYEAASLREAVADRLDLLSARVREVLRLGALLGDTFSVSDLAVMSGLPMPDLTRMVDVAVAAGVLTAEPLGLAFRHRLVRDVLREQIPAGMRAALHLEAARRGVDGEMVARQLAAVVECGGELPASGWVVDWLADNGTALDRERPRRPAPRRRCRGPARRDPDLPSDDRRAGQQPRSGGERPISGWAALTAAETRVARFVVEGKSNPQIAAELVVSRRTVETDVSHILAKLGQRSRVGIVRVAAAHW